jgi:hypothetical protein
MNIISDNLQQLVSIVAIGLTATYVVGEYLVRHRSGLGDELNTRIETLFAKLTPVAEIAARDNQ